LDGDKSKKEEKGADREMRRKDAHPGRVASDTEKKKTNGRVEQSRNLEEKSN